jgi:hypothetical protein
MNFQTLENFIREIVTESLGRHSALTTKNLSENDLRMLCRKLHFGCNSQLIGLLEYCAVMSTVQEQAGFDDIANQWGVTDWFTKDADQLILRKERLTRREIRSLRDILAEGSARPFYGRPNNLKLWLMRIRGFFSKW